MTRKLWTLVVLAVVLAGVLAAGVTYYLTSDGQHSTPTVGRCAYQPTGDFYRDGRLQAQAAQADAKQDASLCPGSWEQVPRSQTGR